MGAARRIRRGEFLIVDVDWVPDSRSVAFQVQDREQTWLDLNLADAASARTSRVLRETTPAWVNVNGSATWLKDGSFVWLSERSGFKHLYRYRRDGSLVGRVTDGRWEVRTFYGVDEERGVAQPTRGRAVISTTTSTASASTGRASHGYRGPTAPIAPSSTRRSHATSECGATPPRLHRCGSIALTVPRFASLTRMPFRPRAVPLVKPEFVEVRARDGFVMDAMIIKPPDFDPSRRYPVFQLTYSGPGTASVRNQWAGSTFMYHQLLAQHGVVVWVLDNRSASGRRRIQWPVYLARRARAAGSRWTVLAGSSVRPSSILLASSCMAGATRLHDVVCA